MYSLPCIATCETVGYGFRTLGNDYHRKAGPIARRVSVIDVEYE